MNENLTYRNLLERLNDMTPEELNMNVSVFVRGVDEFYPVSDMNRTYGSDVLDDGHPYLVV